MAKLDDALNRFEACLYKAPSGKTQSVKDTITLVVSARQELAALIGELINATREDPRLAKHPTFGEEFSTRLFAMRQGLGKLQSDWRAVQIGENPQAYSAVAMPVANANRAFVKWAKDGLSALA